MRKLLYHVDLYPDDTQHYPDCGLLLNDGVVEKIVFDYQDYLGQYEQMDLQGLTALPGFIDVHCHGGYGYDFLKQPKQAVKNYSKGCLKEGTTAYLASFVSEDRDCLLQAAQAYQTIEWDGYAECLGIHLEGPFLNNQYLAVMRPGTLRNPDIAELKQLIQASNHHIVDMTLAVELPGAFQLADYAQKHQIQVMIGHSDCSVALAKEAIRHHVKGITHLYNAMSGHSHRNPGLVSAGLLLDDLVCELICDGFHVDPDVIAITYKTIGSKRLALITDSSLVKGLPDGQYEFSSQNVIKKGIKATVKETGRIAGSVVGMIDCVRNIIAYTGCSLNDIVSMACINPSKIANVEQSKGKLIEGYDGDMVLLNQNLEVVYTFVKGEKVYDQKSEELSL